MGATVDRYYSNSSYTVSIFAQHSASAEEAIVTADSVCNSCCVGKVIKQSDRCSTRVHHSDLTCWTCIYSGNYS